VILELGTTPVVPQIRKWLRGVDLNHRPLGYEPNELPDCSTPHLDHSNHAECRQTLPTTTAAQMGLTGTLAANSALSFGEIEARAVE
jgi:hypothetical protein